MPGFWNALLQTIHARSNRATQHGYLLEFAGVNLIPARALKTWFQLNVGNGTRHHGSINPNSGGGRHS
jgi:hypothetical protein